jgi:predicted TIM-barrel fold metal-dependent hydrolase
MPDLDEHVARFSDHPAGVGVRVVVNPDSEMLQTSECRAIFAAASAADLPVFVWVYVGRLHALSDLVESFPSLRLVVDHLGMRDVSGRYPFDRLDELLVLAQHPKVVAKCSGTMGLSREEYPFADLWPHLHRVLEAFGPERVMWGSDITQHMRRGTYAESVDFVRRSSELSDVDKSLVLGGSARAILGWPSWPAGLREAPASSAPSPLEGPPHTR